MTVDVYSRKMKIMSYHFTISPRELSISPEALDQLRWDQTPALRSLEQVVNFLEDKLSIYAEVSGYSDGAPVLEFELGGFRSPEREGVDGVVARLKDRLRYADAQRFEIVDEGGVTAIYDHPGFQRTAISDPR